MTVARIAIDIDSTLHPYWDQLAAVARRRFGVSLPYEEQRTWAISRLRPAQLAACVAETHEERLVLAAEPYPGAVDALAAWRRAGHYLHITSHRSADAHAATERWLEQNGVACDDLHCSSDKIARCVELEIDLLIDDSPVNLERALDAGMRAATILHPWNAELCETEDVVAAATWPELAARLEPLLAPARASLAGAGRHEPLH